MFRKATRSVLLLTTGAVALVVLTMATGCLQQASAPLSAGPAPEQPETIRIVYAPGDITRLSDEATGTAQASLDAIAALPQEARTFDATLARFDEVITDYRDATRPLILMGYVHPDPAIASEGMACEQAANTFLGTVYTRRDLYDAMKDQVPENPEEERLYSVTIKRFEKNGLSISEERLEEVRAMKADLALLESRFMENQNNDNTTIEFTFDELAGLPPEVLSTFAKTDTGTYLVTAKTPDYTAVMTFADRNETRMRMQQAYLNRQAEENTQLLEEALVLRQQIARELGYATWADYQLDGRMAESTENVTRFIESLKGLLLEKSERERAALLEIKKSLDPGAATVASWDIDYLQEIQKERLYSFDEEGFREYFPTDVVLENMFALYGPMFGITFIEVEGARVWAPDVRLYRVDNRTDKKTIGYLYLDLYPRAGKFGHFTEFPLISGRLKNGTYTVPVTAILGNFRASDGEKPPTLSLFELEELFHEMGHSVHLLLTRAPYGTLSSANVEMDFYETVPQTLSEWIFDPEVLESLSGHYTNRSEKIPENLSRQAIAAHGLGSGIYWSRQVAITSLDMAFHTLESPINITGVADRVFLEATGMPLAPDSHFSAGFLHSMGGYDAGYYGYLWSKVYAQEIVEQFWQDGMTNETTGMKFRDEILAPGNMEDGKVLLERFLGKEPGYGPFYRRLGISPQAES